ncbi:MAG: hypothetical protein K9J13_04190 [Saprospiraceae bacterium]|nr:hypothetical protein [Saprospiraceae bacterium]
MKKVTFIALFGLLITACSVDKSEKIEENTNLPLATVDTNDATNDFYDDVESYEIPLNEISIEGEIENPGVVDFSKLTPRNVIVKETLLSDSADKFVGAYRYEGYSLYDILNNIKLKKKNFDEFNRIIDMYVQVENDKGEKVNISWGEIYYPNHLNEIIIANRVMRIVPTKSKDLWPLTEESKLIVASDLITERNISNPKKIVIKSYPKSFETVKGLKPLYSEKIDVYNENTLAETLTEYPEGMQLQKFNSIFYGRGRGIHSTQPFTGVLLKEILAKYIQSNKKNMQEGIFLVVAKDGYRAVFSFSELMNRNDQSEILLLCRPKTKNNGIFKLFPACDFFSDRAIKGITEIYFSANEK